jgi:hypothetical protein
MKFITYILSLFVFMAMLSCETIVSDVDLSKFPELQEKIVVTSFINPLNDSVTVRVSRSIPLLGSVKKEFIKVYNKNIGDSVLIAKDEKQIEDAIITISDGTTSAKLFYNKELLYYGISSRDFRIRSGRTYTLTVKVDNQVLEAQTTVPSKRPTINNLIIGKYFEVSSSFFGKDTAQGFALNFDWTDFPNEVNYYKVWGEMKYFSDVPSGSKDSVVYYRRPTYGYLELNNDFSSEGRYFSDKNKDGGKYTILNAKLLFRKIYICFGSNFNNDCLPYKTIENSVQSFTLEVSQISKELYDYQNSLRAFNNTSNNPFAEPVPVYSNIKNGLGIFAAYNPTRISQGF